MTHCSDPIPYLIYKSSVNSGNGACAYDEENAEKTGAYVEFGYELMKKLING
jgi:2,3-bisphosphoglycerate-independent phosphoglycerate mutase